MKTIMKTKAPADESAYFAFLQGENQLLPPEAVGL